MLLWPVVRALFPASVFTSQLHNLILAAIWLLKGSRADTALSVIRRVYQRGSMLLLPKSHHSKISPMCIEFNLLDLCVEILMQLETSGSVRPILLIALHFRVAKPITGRAAPFHVKIVSTVTARAQTNIGSIMITRDLSYSYSYDLTTAPKLGQPTYVLIFVSRSARKAIKTVQENSLQKIDGPGMSSVSK